MKTALTNESQQEAGSILAYFMILMIVAVSLASVGAYVAQSSNLSRRRSNMAEATQFAIGGAVVACSDLNQALTNSGSATLGSKLTTLANPYALNSVLSTSSNSIYQRTIYSPFPTQSVIAQIRLPSGSSPSTADITATATVGSVSQTAK